MNYVLNKYKKYHISYSAQTKKIYIKSKIPVKTFQDLKFDLIELDLHIKDIVIES